MKSIRPRGIWNSHFDDATVRSTWGWRGGGGGVVMEGTGGKGRGVLRWHRLQEVYVARL